MFIFLFWLDQKKGQIASNSQQRHLQNSLERASKKNVFHRIIKKNQNKNFVKKIKHKYFGSSDVMNVSMNMCSPVKAFKSFVYEKNPALHYSLEPRGSKKGWKS